LISERLFNTLPLEERVYWHSHHFEVAVSGTQPQRERTSSHKRKEIKARGLVTQLADTFERSFLCFRLQSGMLVLPGVPEMAERPVVQEIASQSTQKHELNWERG
jgi:hypothetical protein